MGHFRKNATVLALIGLATGLWVGGPSAYGGTVVVQKVETLVGKSRTTAEHQWRIDGKKFRLTVISDGAKTDYIFNGRTFIVCSGLRPEQIAILEQYGDNKAQVEKKFQDVGLCQNVPSNFMTRFFLNPTGAVGSVDLTDGMKITLAMTRYQLNEEPKTPKTTGNCLSREYTFKRQIKRGVKADPGLPRETSSIQKVCLDPKHEWRKTFWREVAKSVMRQPKSTALLNNLRKDSKEAVGLAVSGEEDFVSKSVSGRTLKGKRVWQTVSAKEQKLSAATFRRPKDFSIYSPKQLVGMVKSEKSQEEESLEKLPAVFFCAMAGPLGCILSNMDR